MRSGLRCGAPAVDKLNYGLCGEARGACLGSAKTLEGRLLRVGSCQRWYVRYGGPPWPWSADIVWAIIVDFLCMHLTNSSSAAHNTSFLASVAYHTATVKLPHILVAITVTAPLTTMDSIQSTTAIVARAPQDGKRNWKLEQLQLRAPSENEAIVEMVASGVCHTDLGCGTDPDGTPGFPVPPYPRVLGHEGIL